MPSRLPSLLLLLLSAVLLGGACDSGPAGPPLTLVCATEGASCSGDGACCTFRCVNGACAGVVYGCFQINSSCISGPQCCSGVCTQAGFCAVQGVAGTCTPLGAACGDNEECCSNNCNAESNTCNVGQACSDDFISCTYAVECCSRVCDGKVCQPVACTPRGQVCTADHQCCAGDYCDKDVCAPCVSGGGACAVAADCCSGHCDAGACGP